MEFTVILRVHKLVTFETQRVDQISNKGKNRNTLTWTLPTARMTEIKLGIQEDAGIIRG